MIRLLAALLALAICIPEAQAFDEDWDWSFSTKQTRRASQRRHHTHRRHRLDGPRVYAYQQRDEEFRDLGHSDRFCAPATVRGLGTQWIGTEGALTAARKDWMEHVRYDFGEKYLDMTNAKSEESRCSRVSIGEVAGQVTYRCEIWARPCKGKSERSNPND